MPCAIVAAPALFDSIFSPAGLRLWQYNRCGNLVMKGVGRIPYILQDPKTVINVS